MAEIIDFFGGSARRGFGPFFAYLSDMIHCGTRRYLLKRLLLKVSYNISIFVAGVFLLGYCGIFNPSWPQTSKDQLIGWYNSTQKQPPMVASQNETVKKPAPAPIIYSQKDILSDPENRISEDFKIPKKLKRRTAFWLDIYTKYGEHEHVIHHVRYPWIVFKVVDGNSIMNSGKGRIWQRKKRVQRLVATEKRKIRKALTRLSKKRSFKKLTALERRLYKSMKGIRGKRKYVFRMASRNVRSQLGQKDFFQAGLIRSEKYMNFMETEFKQLGLPFELTRIPFVESSFNEEAQSKVGASGIWQIMPRTGKAYGIVGKTIDERNSPMKSTRMAAQVLKTGKRALGNWPLAVTAYNHGVGNIRSAIRGAKSKDLGKIISRYHRGHFKFASANFFTCFLAALHAERYQDSFFQKVQKERPLDFIEIKLAKRFRVKTVIKTSGLDRETFFIYNRDLKLAIQKNTLLPRGFKVHIPTHKAEHFLQKISSRGKKKARSRT